MATRYTDYLQSEDWRALSSWLRACFPVCQVCGAAPSAEVHHRTYAHLGAEREGELVAVCAPCHDAITTTSDCLPGSGDRGRIIGEVILRSRFGAQDPRLAPVAHPWVLRAPEDHPDRFPTYRAQCREARERARSYGTPVEMPIERVLVHVLLAQRDLVPRAREAVASQRFRHPHYREIAEALYADAAGPASSGAQAVWTALTAQPLGDLDLERGFAACVSWMQDRDDQERLAELDRLLALAPAEERTRLLQERRELVSQPRGFDL